MNIDFIEVKQPNQIDAVAAIADRVWHEHYSGLLSQSQIDYMLEQFQSSEAVISQIENENYCYYLLESDGESTGYIGVKTDGNRLFLSKIYVLDTCRGKGVATAAFAFLEKLCFEKGLSAIYLTVNKYNRSSIDVYSHKGYHIIDSIVTNIGNGYVMDDYIMEKKLSF